MRLFPIAFGVALLGLAALFFVLVYYAVQSIWGFENSGTRWEWAAIAAAELILATFFAWSTIRILRRR